MASILRSDVFDLFNSWGERVAFNQGFQAQKIASAEQGGRDAFDLGLSRSQGQSNYLSARHAVTIDDVGVVDDVGFVDDVGVVDDEIFLLEQYEDYLGSTRDSGRVDYDDYETWLSWSHPDVMSGDDSPLAYEERGFMSEEAFETEFGGQDTSYDRLI